MAPQLHVHFHVSSPRLHPPFTVHFAHPPPTLAHVSNARRPSAPAPIVVAGPCDGRYPLELGLAAGFINPRYGVDDIIAKYVCAGGTEAM